MERAVAKINNMGTSDKEGIFGSKFFRVTLGIIQHTGEKIKRRPSLQMQIETPLPKISIGYRSLNEMYSMPRVITTRKAKIYINCVFLSLFVPGAFPFSRMDITNPPNPILNIMPSTAQIRTNPNVRSSAAVVGNGV